MGSLLSLRAAVEGEMSTPREVHVGVPQGPILAPTLYSQRSRVVTDGS
jgi:hypothetical protein